MLLSIYHVLILNNLFVDFSQTVLILVFFFFLQ